MRVYGTAYKAIGCVVGILGLALIPVLKFIINEPPNIHENIYFLYVLFLFSTASSYFSVIAVLFLWRIKEIILLLR